MKRAIALAALATLCSCIPIKKTYVTWPGRVLRVTDGKGPIEGAAVRVTRIGHPHSREEESRVFTTDAKGEVRLLEEKTTKKVYPLMMHGVPGISFAACAEAAGRASTSVSWWEGSAPLEVVLPRGSRPCVRAPRTNAPEAGSARLDGIEEKDGDWLVELAMPAAQKLEIGGEIRDGDSKLVVREIPFRSSSDSPIRIVHVRAKGDGASWKYGDLLGL